MFVSTELCLRKVSMYGTHTELTMGNVCELEGTYFSSPELSAMGHKQEIYAHSTRILAYSLEDSIYSMDDRL